MLIDGGTALTFFRYFTSIHAALTRLARAIALNGTKCDFGGIDIGPTFRIDGIVRGNIRARVVVIGSTATVQGSIYADTVIVHGCVEGDIYARSVHLRSTCHVTAIILQEFITIALGAFFEDDCAYSCDALAGGIRTKDSSVYDELSLRLAS